MPHEELQFRYDWSEFEAMVGGFAEFGAEIHRLAYRGIVAAADESVAVEFDPKRSGETLDHSVRVLSTLDVPRQRQ